MTIAAPPPRLLDAPVRTAALAPVATAGLVYSLGLNWLMSESERRRRRAQLVELSARRPAASALTFALVYLVAAMLWMLASYSLSAIVVSFAGSWSSQLGLIAGAASIATRMLLVLRSLWQS